MNTETPAPQKESLLPLLREFFRNEEGVELAYLFGSVAQGKEGSLSDIDIDVHLCSGLTKVQRDRKRLELIAGLTTLTGSYRVDLLVLNDTPPVLSFEIIRPNVLVFERDSSLKVDVEHLIMSCIRPGSTMRTA
jgi:predicted nucleotidyltransferase